MARGRKPNRKWSLWPSKHAEVCQLLQQDGLQLRFNHQDDDESCIETYDTNIMGLFHCNNSNCQTVAWSSKCIAITIRMYPGMRYNARVYHQHCLQCNFLSKPDLDDSYADRVAYRLKKWNGIAVEPPDYIKKQSPPHEEDHCEGCKAGHCLKSLTRRFQQLVVAGRSDVTTFATSLLWRHFGRFHRKLFTSSSCISYLRSSFDL
ncbi:zinc-binding domain-containing protein [Xylaria palmicola]|nr:zinc-binding domain-containing protein [Xylaria palmicola]